MKKTPVLVILSILVILVYFGFRHYERLYIKRQVRQQLNRLHDKGVYFNLSTIFEGESEFYRQFNRYGSIDELAKLSLDFKDQEMKSAKVLLDEKRTDFIGVFSDLKGNHYYVDSQKQMFISRELHVLSKPLSFRDLLIKVRSMKKFRL